MIRASQPRVLFCSNAYPPKFIGGAELIVEKHARELRSLGYEAAVFAGEGQEAWGPHHAIRQDAWNDVPVWRVQLNHEDFANTGVNFINRPVEDRFEEVLDTFQPTVVHCHNLIGLSVQLLHQAKRRGLRTGLTLHDHWMYCPRNTLVTPDGDLCDPRCNCQCQTHLSDHGGREIPMFLRAGMMRKIAEEADFFHFPSSYLRDIHVLWGLPGEKCWAIPNGIELDRFAQIRRDESSKRIRLTFVGYMGQHKGVEMLVDALAATPENDRLFLNLVGNGELRKPLTERVEELGIADRVKFWKQVPNEKICEVYEQTDCLVLPSLWPENHPVSINEALACGIPVIASNSGGIPELVSHCKTGYLFEQGNQAELQRIFSHVARNPDCLGVLSENARRDSQRLSLQRSVSRMLDLYVPKPPLAADANHGATDRGQPSWLAGASSDSSPPRRCLTVACVGNRFDPAAVRVVEELESSPLRSVVRMLWRDWMYESQWDDIDILWVIDLHGALPSLEDMREDAIALVPEDHERLASLAGEERIRRYGGEEGALAEIIIAARSASGGQQQAAATIHFEKLEHKSQMPRQSARVI